MGLKTTKLFQEKEDENTAEPYKKNNNGKL